MDENLVIRADSMSRQKLTRVTLDESMSFHSAKINHFSIHFFWQCSLRAATHYATKLQAHILLHTTLELLTEKKIVRKKSLK